MLLPSSSVFDTGSALLWTHPYLQILHTWRETREAPRRWVRGWSTSHMKKDWGMSSIVNHHWCTISKPLQGGLKKIQAGFCQWCPVTGQAADTTWTQKGLAEHQETSPVSFTKHRLDREVVESPFFEEFQSHLDMVWGNWPSVVLPHQEDYVEWPPQSLPTSTFLWFLKQDNGQFLHEVQRETALRNEFFSSFCRKFVTTAVHTEII